MHSFRAYELSMPSWLCYRITPPSSSPGISLAPAHCVACPCFRQETSHFCTTFGFCLCQYSWLLIQTHICFLSLGAAWNKGKSDYFHSLGVGHILKRSKVNFLHVIFCTTGWYGGWKQHFYIPGLEICSLNYVWVAGLRQRRPGLFSCCSWGGLCFLATSTEKEKGKLFPQERVWNFKTLYFPATKSYTHVQLYIYI